MAKWNGSEAHRAAQARYRRSAKGKAAQARFRATATGKRGTAQSNTRRIYVGQRYQGRAQTVEQADLIRSHIQERLRAFTRQQTGA